jgi:hypothetical protein
MSYWTIYVSGKGFHLMASESSDSVQITIKGYAAE